MAAHRVVSGFVVVVAHKQTLLVSGFVFVYRLVGRQTDRQTDEQVGGDDRWPVCPSVCPSGGR